MDEPASYFYVDVKDNDGSRNWKLEGYPPGVRTGPAGRKTSP
jgi:hypothetical protein